MCYLAVICLGLRLWVLCCGVDPGFRFCDWVCWWLVGCEFVYWQCCFWVVCLLCLLDGLICGCCFSFDACGLWFDACIDLLLTYCVEGLIMLTVGFGIPIGLRY